jgi:hypothetical protein
VAWTSTNGSQIVGWDQLHPHENHWRRTAPGMNGCSPDGRWLGVYQGYTPVLYVYRRPELELVARLSCHAIQAAYTTLRALYPTHASALDSQLATALAQLAHQLWRPHHAIRLADTDGNPHTIADPEWTALIPTPRFPEYFSNHATLTGAMMRVLERELGDEHEFTLSSPLLPGFSQSYERFSQAAAQARDGRTWGGIHFRHACEVGGNLGVALADYVRANFLAPRSSH